MAGAGATGTALTVNVKVWFALPVALRAVIVNAVLVVTTLGVPLINPVLVSNVNPREVKEEEFDTV